MFKAKLIENERYYKLRSKQILLTLLPSLLIGLIVNFFQSPIWLTIVVVGLYLLTMVLFTKNQRRLNLLLGKRLVEIDEKEIRIKSKKGIQQEVIKLEKVEKLLVKDDYSMSQETIQEVGEEIIGKTKQNYLIVLQNNQKRKIDFEVDSYYMIKQLNKIIENWKVVGYDVEQLKQE